jgi:phage shock protein A
MPDDLAARLVEHLEQLREEVRGLKLRMTLAEEGKANTNRRLDRLEARLDTVEARAAAILK